MEYRVSKRVVLLPGDKFRVAGGPYWKMGDGRRIPIAVRGVCTFVRATQHGSRVYLEATNKDGAVLLHVEGRRRNKSAPEIVCRPYKVRGKLRKKKGKK
jgi:hypothetical protein